ncbi:unnamed protein product, partial [Adineta ricciae]
MQSITFSAQTPIVYIPDLPTRFSEDDLKEVIKKRLSVSANMEVVEVICYPKLGIGMIQTENSQDKEKLIADIQSLALGKKYNVSISFVDKLELDSYVVFDENISSIPKTDEAAQQFKKSYKTQAAPECKPIAAPFPNIFHIVLETPDELVKVANSPEFTTKNGISAVVYPNAECCFFEDLPSNVNSDKLASAVASQTGVNVLPPTSFHVQYCQSSNSAVVIAVKSESKWIADKYLNINGQNLPKKKDFTYRVLVSPVPRDIDVNLILNHRMFTNHVVRHQHINDHLVIELDNIDVYKECIENAAIGIGGKPMNISPYTSASVSNSNELDATNWYETVMVNMKPDIMLYVFDYKHAIFNLPWNEESWLEQMGKIEGKERRSKTYDHQRHLLRVTVMLNTIGVVRKKKYVVGGEEISLKSERLQTIRYDYKSKIAYGRQILESEFKTPYSSTTVRVVNEDCLVLYQRLVSEGCRPLLLNMANAKTPGGGYRKGDGAQEENIFRRSDYYQSLDLEVADRERYERLYQSSKGDIKRAKDQDALYPMKEFEAIYTSGITVFRGTEENGYAFLKKPLYDVCAIAMAAYRDPPLTDKNMLQDRSAINTLKKIENVFTIAHQHNHDCLVLSALGCGAFKNPPEHVALLFKSIIRQYAGYFKTIYFAILDDHNTGNSLNPQGNLLPFQEVFNKFDAVYPPKSLRVNSASGPYRILNKSSDGKVTLSDVCILHLPPCENGSKCAELNDAGHKAKFSHPPVCPLLEEGTACTENNDEVHMFTFLHNSKCKYGGQCTNTDAKHLSDYEHPDYCPNHLHCHEKSSEHLIAYRHLPVCRDGETCLKYLNSDVEHCKSYRHCKLICSDDNTCVRFHDQQHMENTTHTFRPPCPFTPYHCSRMVKYVQHADGQPVSEDVERHCLTFSHVCPYGCRCTANDKKHYLTYIHIARHICADGELCMKMKHEHHLESYSHPGVKDIRLLCKNPGHKCHDRLKSDHLKKYRHGENHNHLSVAPCSNFNSSINFPRNQGEMIRAINTYIQTEGWKETKISPEIINWIQALQPVHRCNKFIFESILVHGHVMSRHYMELLKRPQYVVQAVLQHSRIRRIFLEHNTPEVKHNVSELVKILVHAEFGKTGADGMSPAEPDHDSKVLKFEKKLKPPLTDSDIKAIHNCTIEIAQASIKLTSSPMGIGFDVDKKLGTDHHIFSILGPHHGFYYGDIVITFKQEIMFHPDANFTVQAGTSFPSGRIYQQRPWKADPGGDDKRVRDFHYGKLHCSVPRYEYAAAAELVAVTGLKKQSMGISLDAVIHNWKTLDSHFVFESHLPQLI